MSMAVYVVHEAGPVIGGRQVCARCGEDLPRDNPRLQWSAGARVAKLGTAGESVIQIYDIPDSFELDEDEIECAGAVDVGMRVDA